MSEQQNAAEGVIPAGAKEPASGSDQQLEPSNADLRLQRLEDFQREALLKPDSLAANLGAANGALMRMGYRLEEAIEGALEKVASSAERFERLVPPIEMYLKVMRQVDRFAQLDQRIQSSRQGGGPAKPR